MKQKIKAIFSKRVGHTLFLASSSLLLVTLFIVGGWLTAMPASAAVSDIPNISAAVTATSSSLYSGYEVLGPAHSVLRIKGSWIVPAVNCAIIPNSVSNMSVIIDGINGAGDAMQIGTYSDCVNGVVSYGTFVNFYP